MNTATLSLNETNSRIAELPNGRTLLEYPEHPNTRTPERPCLKQWHVLWVHSQCEQMVCDQMVRKGFDPFLPKIDVWSRRNGSRHITRRPMFPGYLFVHHAMDKASYLAVVEIRGLVRLLGESWDRLAVVPDEEMEAIQRVACAKLPATPHPYLREGQRVRITGGVLANVEGIFLRSNPSKGLLVISVGLLHRSVAVEVDCTLIAPA